MGNFGLDQTVKTDNSSITAISEKPNSRLDFWVEEASKQASRGVNKEDEHISSGKEKKLITSCLINLYCLLYIITGYLESHYAHIFY